MDRTVSKSYEIFKNFYIYFELFIIQCTCVKKVIKKLRISAFYYNCNLFWCLSYGKSQDVTGIASITQDVSYQKIE